MGYCLRNRREALAKWRECKTISDRLNWHVEFTPWLGRDMIFKELPEFYAEKEKASIEGKLEEKDLLEEESEYDRLLREMHGNRLD